MRLKAAAGPEFTACDALTGRYCFARTACHLIVRRGRGVLQTFPRLSVRKDSPLPAKSLSRLGTSSMDDWDEIDSHRWLEDSKGDGALPDSLYEKTLVQDDGYKVTLLTYDPEE